jgi:predicted ATPase/transcriptional regulator with XRE-family HTH domain
MASSNKVEINSSIGEPDSPLFFGDWLKRRRKKLDLTQNELAERACCSVFALRKIEAGERRPSKQLAGMLANPLEIPAGDLPTFIKVARGEFSTEKLLPLVSAASPAPKTGPLPGNLPRALTPFIGREPELTALAQLLHDPHCSLLTIVGPGGIGKTRLAIETAHQLKAHFPDGVWFVPLASLNSPTLIVPAIAEAVGFKFQDPTDMQAQLNRHLRPKKALLVLDNAEHLLEGVGIFSEILKDCQQMKLLVTSRERLNLISEWVFEIQGLPLPPNDQAKQFEAYSSVALFSQSARRVQAGFEIRVDDRQWILKICQIMEGLPLGIELSAAWVGLLSIDEIAKEIEHNLDFLTATLRDIPERHRSLRATLDHSWKLLNADEKLILSRLSVFRGGFHRAAAKEICGANLAVLSSLKNKTLLYRTDQNYYELHEIVRQYAELKLAEDNTEYVRIKGRHASYFVQYLSNCEEALQGLRQVEIFDEMARIIEDLSQAWQHMVSHYRPSQEKNQSVPAELIHPALFSLSLFYEMRCRSLEAIGLFKESVEALKSISHEIEDTKEAPRFRSILGHITAYLGLHHCYIIQYDLCQEYLEEALKLLQDDQSRVVKAQVQVMLASAKNDQGKLLESMMLLIESREVFRQEGVEWWYVLSTSHLAVTYMSLGKVQESKALYQEALRLIKPGDLRTELPTRSGYAVLLFYQNEFSEAEQILLDNLELSYRLHNDRQTAYILSYLGRVAAATNRLELAEDYLQKSISILLEFGESQDLAMVYINLGKCFAVRSDLNPAREKFRQVIKLGQVLDKFHLVYYGLVNIASTYVKEGQTEKALEIFLLLRRCPVEFIRMQADYDQLQSDLQAALPEWQLENAMMQQDEMVSLDEANADVLAFVQEHEAG